MKKLLSNLSQLKAEKVKYQFVINLQDLLQFDAGLKEAKLMDPTQYTYAFLWKRGSKRNGKSESIELKDGKLAWNYSFTLDITLFKDQKKGFLNKNLELSLEATDKKSRKTIIGKGEVNLGAFVANDQEKKSQISIIVTIAKKPCKLNLSLDSIPKKLSGGDDELDSLSSMTETSDDDDNGSSRPSFDKAQNLELLNRIQDLQNKIRELELIKDPKSDKQELLETICKERDDWKKKTKYLEALNDEMKVDLDKLRESAKITDQKGFEAQIQVSKLTQEVNELKQQIPSNSEDWKQIHDDAVIKYNKEISELKNQVTTINKNKDEQVKALESQINSLVIEVRKSSGSSDVSEVEKQGLMAEIASLKTQLESAKNLSEVIKKKNEETVAMQSNQIKTLEESVKKTQQEKNDSVSSTGKQIELLKEQQKKIFTDFETEKKNLREEIVKLKKEKVIAPMVSVPVSGSVGISESDYNKLKAALEEEKKSKILLEQEYKSKDSAKGDLISKIMKAQEEKEKFDKENNDLKIKVRVLEKKLTSTTPTTSGTLTSPRGVSSPTVTSQPSGPTIEEVKKIREDNEALKTQLKQVEIKDNKIKELESKIKSLGEVKPNTSELERLGKEVDKKNKEIEQLRTLVTNSQSDPTRKMSYDSASNVAQEYDKIKRDMMILTKELTEKFVIENTVLFMIPEYDGDFPIIVKIIWNCINVWKVFDKSQNTTFCENLVKSLDFTVERDSHDHEKLIYWIHTLYRLLALLRSDYAEVYKATIGNPNKHIKRDFVINPKRSPPIFLSSLKGEIKRGGVDMNVSKFCFDLYQILIKTYFLCHNNLNHKLGKIMTKSIFEAKKEKVLSTIKSGDLNQSLEVLNTFHDAFVKQRVDNKVISSFFASEILFIDSFILNSILKEKNYTSLGIEIKMYLSILEVWFEEKGIKGLKPFPYARQSADVCVIAEKSILTDKSMRNAICPNLSIGQIGRLLSIYHPDDLNSKNVPKEVLESLKDASNPGDLVVKYQIDYDGCFGGLQMDGQKDLLSKVAIPERFTSQSAFDFIK